MATDPKFGATYAEESIANGHIIFNRLIQRLNAVVQCHPESRGDTSPPSSPTDGQHYILGASPTGNWSSFSQHDIAFYFADQSENGGWIAITPDDGWFAYVQDADEWFYFNGTSWVDVCTIKPTTHTEINSYQLRLDSDGDTHIRSGEGGDDDHIAFTSSGDNTWTMHNSYGLLIIDRGASTIPSQIQIARTSATAPAVRTGYTTITGIILAPVTTTFSIDLPSGYSNSNPGWIKCWNETAEIAIPFASSA